jgi:hypothetical protein
MSGRNTEVVSPDRSGGTAGPSFSVTLVLLLRVLIECQGTVPVSGGESGSTS